MGKSRADPSAQVHLPIRCSVPPLSGPGRPASRAEPERNQLRTGLKAGLQQVTVEKEKLNRSIDTLLDQRMRCQSSYCMETILTIRLQSEL